jgi:hypothetical protein
MYVRFAVVFMTYLSLENVFSNRFDEPFPETSVLEEISSSETLVQNLNGSSESPVTDSSDLFSDMDLANSETNVPWDNLYTLADANVQSSCASQADRLNLEARDNALCRPSKDQPTLTPEMLQLSEDPVGILENTIHPKKGQAPGPSEPSEQDPPFPDLFSDKEVREKVQPLFEDLDANPCPSDDGVHIFNACCDGPCEGLSIPPVFVNLIQNCNLGTFLNRSSST